MRLRKCFATKGRKAHKKSSFLSCSLCSFVANLFSGIGTDIVSMATNTKTTKGKFLLRSLCSLVAKNLSSQDGAADVSDQGWNANSRA